MKMNDLEKGLAALEQLASTPQGRAGELFAKAQTGNLTTEERAELVKSLAQDNLAARTTAPFTENDSLRKSIDVSDYLREQNVALLSSLTELANSIEKSEGRDQEFRVALAQTLVSMGGVIGEQGALIKSMQESLATFGQQPARAPKSAHTAAAAPTLAKSFAGQAQGDQLSKAQISDALYGMLEKGMSTVGGEPLLQASSKYEMFSTISAPALDAVMQFVKTNNAA